MTILILATHFNQGGISRYCINLAKGLIARGHKIIIGSCGGEWVDKLATLGISHQFIPIKTKSILSPKIIQSFFILRPIIEKENIQLIHANTRVTQMLGYLFYKFCKIPYVSSFHGFYRPKFSRRAFKLSGLISITVSKSVKNHLIDDLNIQNDKIRVIYNGIDRDEFSGGLKKKSDLGFKDTDFLVGILGRISEEKGHFLSVEAIKSISAKYRNVYLIVSGKGKLESHLKLFIKKIAMQEKVKLINWEPQKFFDILDLLIVPSQKEGFGFIILEAFVKGVPVVGFNVGGIAEIIRDRESGLLFYQYNHDSLAASIEELISNDNLRNRIIEGGRKSIQPFSLENMAEATEKVYEEVLG